MYNQEMNTHITQKLASTPMLYLSLGSKELFHSNFLYWLGTNYRDKFQELIARLLNINSLWPEGWTLRREYLHLDLCITYQKEKKNGKGKKGTEECVFVIIENKVKSLPDIVQLKRYEKKFSGRNGGRSYAVFSLVKDFPGQKCLTGNTSWQLHHYDELAALIRDCCPDDVILTEHRPYIRDYCQFVENLSKLAEGWIIDEQSPFLSSCENLHELRLNDIYEKVRYGQIAALLAERMKSVLESVVSEEEKVVLGMSNAEVILRRGHKDAEEILACYGCPEANPFQQVFIGSGLSHGVGLVEAKVKVSNDCCLVLQVQGNRYCHGIEKQNIVHNSTSLSEWLRNFIDFKFGGLLDHKSQPDSKQCQYKDGFLYKSQKIEPNFKVGHIVDAMKNDLEIILRAKLNPDMPTTS